MSNTVAEQLADTIRAAEGEQVAADVKVVLQADWRQRAADIQQRAAALGEVNKGLQARRMEAMRLTMRVDEDSYHYWGQRLGYECWKDPQFIREYKRDNPECCVAPEPQKVFAGVAIPGSRSPHKGRIITP